MNNLRRLILLSAAGCSAGFGQNNGFSLENLDKSVDPCNNFFQFACGTWIKSNPIPADQSRWGRFNALARAESAHPKGYSRNQFR